MEKDIVLASKNEEEGSQSMSRICSLVCGGFFSSSFFQRRSIAVVCCGCGACNNTVPYDALRIILLLCILFMPLEFYG